jgi:hypothetical protein
MRNATILNLAPMRGSLDSYEMNSYSSSPATQRHHAESHQQGRVCEATDPF